MRQAGRYQPEYRAIREQHKILDIISSAELSAQVTMLPVQQMDVDAAIIFADILPPLVPMGLQLEFAAGEGPVLHNPLRDRSSIEALQAYDPAVHLKSTLDAISMVRRKLADEVALIGFAGGPFTLASYAIEGGSSRNYQRTKTLMYQDEAAWQMLMDKLAGMTIDYLRAQVAAGAQCVQLFDSWAGSLAPGDYRRYVLPATQRIFDGVRETGVPTIAFGTDTAGMLDLVAQTGSAVVGADWRIALDRAWELIGHERAIQGNLDPIALFAPKEELQARVHEILDLAAGRPGHIFNLGHGILPQTPVASLQAVVEMVHNYEIQAS